MNISLFYVIASLSSSLLAFSAIAVYRLYFHPLSAYPGPRLWAISGLPWAYNRMIGILPYRCLELHKQYGPVVRVSPNELTYTSGRAWLEIYGKGAGRTQLKKDPSVWVNPQNGVHDIIFEPDHKAHGRMRRNLSYGFSQKTVNQNEPLIMKHVDLLISKLHTNCGNPLDMVQWYSFLVLDLIGDLAFGEPFNCLETSKLDIWSALLPKVVKESHLLGISNRFSPLNTILHYLAPARLRKVELQHRAFTKTKIHKILESPTADSVFLSSAREKYNTPDGMSFDEIVESTCLLLLAGTDTVTTVLIGTTYFLLMNPPVLEKLNSEIRREFKSETHITISSVSSLPYLSAVINEVLRILPPAPGSMPRITPPQGCIIEGRFVPRNTTVGVTQLAASHLPSNFNRPDEFIPERWTGDEEFKDDKRGAVKPFSVGPRICIGQALALTELRIILAKMIWNFDMGLCEESRGWFGDHLKVYIGFVKDQPLNVILKPVAR